MGEHVDRIDRELARRAGRGLPFSFVVNDKHPAALTDVQAAVKAVIADADNRAAGNWKRVCITSDIHKAVVDALRAAHPRRFILVRTIEESGARHAPVPEAAAGSGTSFPAEHIDEPDRALDVVERARERLSRLRGEF